LSSPRNLGGLPRRLGRIISKGPGGTNGSAQRREYDAVKREGTIRRLAHRPRGGANGTNTRCATGCREHPGARQDSAVFVDEPDDIVNPLGIKGLGEIGIVGVAAAIANAIYHTTGKRVRDLPITLDKLQR
jgi:hypothetical protein